MEDLGIDLSLYSVSFVSESEYIDDTDDGQTHKGSPNLG